jgi:glycosyltransferase involved in cell wall biosynthesis
LSGQERKPANVKVAVIIPAKDEAARIGAVLDVVTRAKLAKEVIVVCDGCTDHTADVARSRKGVQVVELPYNKGKGGAMVAGVAATDAQVIAFVDADLTGLKPEHLDKIILPILTGSCEMCVGVFRGGKFWSDTAQRISPYISGQRAMRRSLFDSIPYLDEIRMGVEVTINTFAKRQKARVLRVVLHGVSNTFKEKKMGVLKGTAARTKMYAEIARAIARNRRKQPKKPRINRTKK